MQLYKSEPLYKVAGRIFNQGNGRLSPELRDCSSRSSEVRCWFLFDLWDCLVSNKVQMGMRYIFFVFVNPFCLNRNFWPISIVVSLVFFWNFVFLWVDMAVRCTHACIYLMTVSEPLFTVGDSLVSAVGHKVSSA